MKKGFLLLLVGVATTAAQDTTRIMDPIPEKPVMSGLGIVVKELVTFPKSEPTPPLIDCHERTERSP